MTKTIYVRDADVPDWDRARELAGDKLSPIIMNGLKLYVAQQEAKVRGSDRLEVTFDDADRNSVPRTVAFHGRWIIPKEKPSEYWNEDGDRGERASVAETVKGQIVVFHQTLGSNGPDSWESATRFRVYESFEKAAADNVVNSFVRDAMKKRGVPVEELDI